MKLLKLLGIALVFAGLVAAAAIVYARGQTATVVRTPEYSALDQVFIAGGRHIGVTVRDVEKADVEREKLAGQSGAVIEEVRSGSAAEKAGLKSGDVLIEYDGERVRSARQLTRLVQETPDGRTVKAAVIRAGKRVEVDLTPEPGPRYFDEMGADLERFGRDLQLRIRPELDRLREELRVEPPPVPEFTWRIQPGRLGIGAQDLTPQLADYFGVKDGVLVTSVTEASVAAKAGVKAGDVITAISGSSVGSVSDVRRRVERLDDGQDFAIAITRDRKAMTLNGKMERAESRSTRRRFLSEI
jgi:serine protease Do